MLQKVFEKMKMSKIESHVLQNYKFIKKFEHIGLQYYYK